MKQLIPADEYGIFADTKERILVDSRFVAEKFGKEHKNVIRIIEEKILTSKMTEIGKLNFEPISYKDSQNRKQPAYVMTLKGFQLLISTFTGENPMPYHFSNECDMLNRIVTGYSAKQIREQHGIYKKTSIRPYLTANEITQLDELQRVDIGLLLVIPDFEERKQRLIQYHKSILSNHQLIGA